MRRSSSPCRRPRTRRTSSTCARSRPTSARKLKALKPDLWIIFSNDHAEQFFHNVCPAFTVHVGGEATGEFAGRKFHWKIPSEIGFELVRQLYRQGFDPAFTSTAKIDYAIGIPLTHIGLTDPVLPIYVNAYLPPQPTMERCYAFGQAVARTVTALGLKTVILSSGGMSHFPGTDRYSNPGARLGQARAGEARRRQSQVADRLRRGRARRHRQHRAALLGLRRRRARASASPTSCRSIRAGTTTTPRSAGSAAAPQDHAAHYPSIKPELVELTAALHALAHDAEQRAQFMADAKAYADRFSLPPDQRAALIALDLPAMVKMGAHPLVPFLAQLQIQAAAPAAVSSVDGMSTRPFHHRSLDESRLAQR